MKKILFISLAVVLAFGVVFLGGTCGGGGGGGPGACGVCGNDPCTCDPPPEPTKIVIGRSVDETGPNASIHWAAGYPIQTLFEIMVNGDCHGMICGNTPCTCTFPAGWGEGIHLKEYDAVGSPCYVPIEFLTYNDASNVENLLINTEKLITEDKVDYIWAGTGTWAIWAQANPVCATHKYVLMTLEGGATAIKKYYIEDLPYLFVHLSFSDWYELPILAKMVVDAHAAEYAGAKPDVFVSYIDDQHGYEYRDVAIAEFAKLGVTIEDPGDLYPMGYDFTDWDDVMDTFIAGANAGDDEYDLFCSFAYPVHVFPLTERFATTYNATFNPNGIIMGPGACFGFYPYFSNVAPADVTGIMTFAVANNDTVVTGGSGFTYNWLFNTMATVMDGFLECPGFFWTDFWGHPLYWPMCEIFKTAVEEVGYVNQYWLKETLASYTQSSPITTALGPTWYELFGEGGGMLSYKCHTGEIGQWGPWAGPGGMRIEIVGCANVTDIIPNYEVTANFTYPMKDLWNWRL